MKFCFMKFNSKHRIQSIALILAVCFGSISNSVLAHVTLPQIVRDSMVLQRDAPINIWGWASPGERITIRFIGKKYTTITTKDSTWKLVVAPVKAGGPYTLQIDATNHITLSNILMGDVWLCSGQSNMVHQINIHDVTYADEIATANYPQIRQFLVATLTSLQGPKNNLPNGSWKPAVGEEVRPFSAVAYFFAKKLYEQYHVPIGLINASVGGTPIEAWTSEEGLKEFPELMNTIQKNKDTNYVNSTNRIAAAATASALPKQIFDKGLTGAVKWFDVNYQPKNWHTINIPGYWEDQGIKDLNGVVWYRKEIEVPQGLTGKAAKLFLGRIVDADVVFINGRQVGTTAYMYPQRRYAIAANVIRPGKNIMVIKVTNFSGKGGFVSNKPYYLVAGNDTLDLKGDWQYKVGEVFKPQIGKMPASVVAQNQPTALYNAMVAPYTNYALKGILWYQGESNSASPQNYKNLQEAQIADWRKQFKQPGLPFLYVQLPNFMEVNYLPGESNWALLREAQLQALEVPNTAMAVAIDLGEWNDIHPDNKKDVGERLALAANKLAYGQQVVASGPLYKSAVIEDNRIVISFTNTGGGLITHDGELLSEFAIAGEDKKFVWANAIIEGDKVIVSSGDVPQPKYVRYAWADNPGNPNLYNKEGLPASPFRTDQ